MKRCSTCNRTYTDPNLSFCIDDGTPLTTVEAEDESTVVRSHGNKDADWNAVAYKPPSAYVPPGSGVKPRRRVWPWVVGIGGAFLVGILAISAVALIMAPRLMRSKENPRVAIREPNNSNTAEKSNSNERTDTPLPANYDQVLAQLTALENEWTVANLNADKKKLDRILADDYVGQGNEQGGLQSKNEYIETIERDDRVEKWEFSNLKLMLAGDRATLTGIITYFSREGSVSFDFKDRFVWRDGRWQATGAELKRRGDVGTAL
jgi:hypothetical protein